jgi:hypothetical protein
MNLHNVMSARRGIAAALINSRSINNKTVIINDMIVNLSLDCLFITESWMTGNPLVDNAILTDACPQNYSFLN